MKKRKSPQVTAKAAESFGEQKDSILVAQSACQETLERLGLVVRVGGGGQEDCCRFEACIGHIVSVRPAEGYRVRPSRK